MRSLPLPAASGSTAPNIEQSADGTLLLSWLEPDKEGHALRYSEFRDGAWQAAGKVSRGDNWFVNWADFPAITALDGAFWAAHWLVRRAAGGYAYDIVTSVSSDAGKSWSEPASPHRDNTDSEHGFVSHFPTPDGVGLVWLDGRQTGGHEHGDNNTSGMTLRGATLNRSAQLSNEQEIDGLVCDCCQTDVTVSADGPVAVYRNRTAGEVRDIYIARQQDGIWQDGVAVADDGWVIGGCPVNGPVVKSRDHEVVVAWFTAADDRPVVRLARSASVDSPFSEPVDVLTEKALGKVGMVLLQDGSAVVSALQSSAPGRARLVLTHVAVDGTILSRIPVADGLPPFSVPQLTRLADHLLVVYSTKDDSTANIASVEVPIADLAH